MCSEPVPTSGHFQRLPELLCHSALKTPPNWTHYSSHTTQTDQWISGWTASITLSTGTVFDRRPEDCVEHIVGSSLPSLLDIYTSCCIHKATTIMADPHHHSLQLFTSPPSRRRLCSVRSRSARLCNSFSPKQSGSMLPPPHDSLLHTHFFGLHNTFLSLSSVHLPFVLHIIICIFIVLWFAVFCVVSL